MGEEVREEGNSRGRAGGWLQPREKITGGGRRIGHLGQGGGYVGLAVGLGLFWLFGSCVSFFLFLFSPSSMLQL